MIQYHLQTLGRLQLNGPGGELLPRRRYELALLVLLAARSPRLVRREELQAMLWGERGEEKARNSIRQALLKLRRSIGEDSIETSGDEIRLRPDVVTYDVRRFEDAASSARYADAIDIWQGEFLPGCDDVGGEGFRSWLDGERVRLRTLLNNCFENAVAEAQRAHDTVATEKFAARWSVESPYDADAQLAAFTALCSSGRTGDATALRAAYTHRLETELDGEPSAGWWYATEDALRTAREQEEKRRAGLPGAPRAPDDVAYNERPNETPKRKHAAALLAAAVILLAVIAGAVYMSKTRSKSAPLLAMGHIEMRGAPDSLSAMPLLMTTNLGRVRALRVLSDSRIRELLTQLHLNGNTEADLQRAARAAGADEVIEGVLSQRGKGLMRLDLRRIDLRTREIRDSYTVESTDVFDLLDNATEQIAQSLGGQRATIRLAGSSTSLVAYRLYEEGLRAYYAGDYKNAGKMFKAAVAEDSTFAMAGYYASRFADNPESWSYLERASRMADALPQRERLIIRANRASARMEPVRLVYAESLAVNYPSEPDAHFEYANALREAGRFAEAAAHYTRAIELDSISFNARTPRCLACEAVPELMSALRYEDSFPAAERVARSWVNRAPANAATALNALTNIQIAQGDFNAAKQSMDRIRAIDPAAELPYGYFWLRSGAFDASDAAWRARVNTQPSGGMADGFYSLRMQGRLNEALQLATRLRKIESTPDNPMSGAFMQGTVLNELGKYAQAAAVFDTLAHGNAGSPPAFEGRVRAWNLAQAATSLAALRDTARLRVIEDTVRIYGARSAYRRDQLLWHYVRALRMRATGNVNGAIQEFRASLYSTVEGNTRAVYELASTLVDAKRGAEAIGPLHAALRGPIAASGTYVNPSETTYLLARAYEQAGRRDSAEANYRFVANAWRNGDPSFRDRRATICALWKVCD